MHSPVVKMKLLVLLSLLYFISQDIYAQQDADGECKKIFVSLNKKFFNALRKIESEGDICKMSTDKLGPYQISEEYYEDAVSSNSQLKSGGKRWEFVWGEGSKEYSEEVIKSYICRHGLIVQRNNDNQQPTPKNLAAIHAGGSRENKNRTNRIFGAKVQRLINDEAKPNDTSQVCQPKCRLGQCCVDGKCLCIDPATFEVDDCELIRCKDIGGLDLVFALDTSGSIGSENFNNARMSIENIVSSLKIGPNNTRVAVIIYSTDVRLLFNLNTYRDNASLIQAIRRIPYTGGLTNTAEAIRVLRSGVLSETLGVRPSNETTQIAIILTDGRSNLPNVTREQAELLRNETDFKVFAVGVGDAVDLDELRHIASSSAFALQIANFSGDELQRFEDAIKQQTCSFPVRLGDNVTLNSTLDQGKVSYYQVRIPEGGLTFMVDVNNGKVLVCGSTTDENPDCRDPSTYSWVCETEGYCDIYVDNNALTKRRRRQASGGDVMFVSIEGVERNNSVVFETMMGDETISDVVSPMTLIDSVIILNDPLYEVPVTHTPPGMDPTTTSLCYQVHGESGSYYNLISDDCIQVNVLYGAMKNPETGNFIKEIGILARDTANNCTEIKLQANRCVPMINGISLDDSYDEDGITVDTTGRRSFEVTVPNCKPTQGDDLTFMIACYRVNKQKIIRFDVSRGGGIKPGAHGLIGQFWNIPVHVLNYTGDYSGSANNTYVVTVDHPSHTSPPRTFIAELHPATWDGKRKQCLYVGNAQSGPVNEVDMPNDYVIEGNYTGYEVSGLFASDFDYTQFQDNKCA